MIARNAHQLIDILAFNCLTAQEHCNDPDAWNISESYREDLLQCVSFQCACWLAQHTEAGGNGVDWDVVQDVLVKHPMRTLDQWKCIFKVEINLLGGFKSPPPVPRAKLQRQRGGFIQ